MVAQGQWPTPTSHEKISTSKKTKKPWHQHTDTGAHIPTPSAHKVPSLAQHTDTGAHIPTPSAHKVPSLAQHTDKGAHIPTPSAHKVPSLAQHTRGPWRRRRLTCQVAGDVGVGDEEVVALVPVLLPHGGLVQDLRHLLPELQAALHGFEGLDNLRLGGGRALHCLQPPLQQPQQEGNQVRLEGLGMENKHRYRGNRIQAHQWLKRTLLYLPFLFPLNLKKGWKCCVHETIVLYKSYLLLFIATKRNMHIFRVSPFFKPQNNTETTVKW